MVNETLSLAEISKVNKLLNFAEIGKINKILSFSQTDEYLFFLAPGGVLPLCPEIVHCTVYTVTLPVFRVFSL